MTNKASFSQVSSVKKQEDILKRNAKTSFLEVCAAYGRAQAPLARNDGPSGRDSKKDGSSISQNSVIFFGNGSLSDYVLDILNKHCDIIFHARTKEDLPEATHLKRDYPDAHGVLASFGVLLKPDFLELWEPEGILNIHPSLLPKYRGPSPIETAILDGDQEFSVSIMKLVEAMDAGLIYHQDTLPASTFSSPLPEKSEIYKSLATAGANWLVDNLNHLPKPKPQSGNPTFTKKLTTDLSPLHPEIQTAEEMLNQIRAYEGFPKSRYNFFGLDCILLSAHLSPTFPEAPASSTPTISPDPSDPNLYITKSSFALKGTDGRYLLIDRLQPAGKRPMDAPSFLNGYRKYPQLKLPPTVSSSSSPA